MRRRRVVLAVAAVGLCAGAALAQFNPADGRGQLRSRQQDKPRSQQNLDDAIRKFTDEDTQTRLEGIEGLGQNPTEPKAVQYLLQGVSDPDVSVRVKAIDVIGVARVKEATPLLVQQLFMRDTSLATKQRVLAALGRIGDPRAIQPILDFLARDIDPNVRGNAVFALGELGDRAAIPPLDKLAKQTGDENLRSVALAAIRKIEQKPAPAVVPPALAKDRGLRGPEEEDSGTP